MCAVRTGSVTAVRRLWRADRAARRDVWTLSSLSLGLCRPSERYMSENYGTECVFLFFVLFVCFSVFKILSIPLVTIKSRQKCLTDIFNLDLVIKTGNCWCRLISFLSPDTFYTAFFFFVRNLRLKDQQRKSRKLEPHQANLRKPNRLNVSIN